MRVLFVDIDTLRPDHMGCYGYSRNTTPRIDGIAKEGMVFDQYYCSDAPCLPSRASLISGQFGIRNGAVGHGGTAADRRLFGKDRDFRDQTDVHCLHNIFRNAGMHTASISSFPERHSAWWFNAGLNETYNVGDGGMESGEKVIPQAIDWLNRKGQEDDWYLHIHLWDPHTPYRAPEGFGNPFDDVAMNTWITSEVFEKHLKHVGPHSINEINMYDDKENPKYPRHPGKAVDRTGLKRLMDGYDTGILYADHLVGQVIDKLKDLGVYEDTMIIITSDHGENMGELGIYAEHGTADHATCNIPFIIKGPGIAQGERHQALHYSLDFLPTMADYFKQDYFNEWDGVSYFSVLDGKTSVSESFRESLVISQMAHVCQRSARFGDWLYMRTYHDGYHLFDKEMLFNIAEDPHEQRNLVSEYPEICAKGSKIILDWHDQQMIKSKNTIDPLWNVLKEGGPYHTRGYLEDYLVRLRETGRAEGAKRLEERHIYSVE